MQPLPVPYETLDETATDRLLEGGRLVEQDRFGPKVYELPGERMLKLFRVKRRLSSNLWSPYARRFVKNSEGLRARGIVSVRCLQWGRLPARARQYVLYEKLAGVPLRQAREIDGEVLGRFFARLHGEGIYFRSCHLGNILATEGGDLGLIDVMDLYFRRRALTERERQRNFRHLRRVRRDRELLEPVWESFLEAYRRERA